MYLDVIGDSWLGLTGEKYDVPGISQPKESIGICGTTTEFLPE
jgi:hypothetical protein